MPKAAGLTIETDTQQFPLQIPQVGDYNVMNALGVVAAALALGLSPAEIIQRGMAALRGGAGACGTH